MSVEATAVSELLDLQVHLTGIKYYFSILVIICPTYISIVNIWIFCVVLKIYIIHSVICRDQHYEEI